MPHQLASEFRQRLGNAREQLAKISIEQADQPFRPGGWLRKELLGHLLDSAANNQIRFVVAALEGRFTGSQYDQEGWVRLQSYRTAPWSDLVELWRLANDRLARIVEQLSEAALASPCTIGQAGPVTLEFLIRDYLRHLEHHLAGLLPQE